MNRRMERVNELMREELSWLLTNEINDPRLPLLIAITRVETSQDLRSAKVFVSIMSGEEEKRSALKMLQSASGFIHRTLKPRLKLRRVPTLSFHLDDSIAEGARMLKIIEELQSPTDS